MPSNEDVKVASFGKWASIILVFITATYTSIKLGLELLSTHKRRSLKANNVLITNGDSSLSRKIGQALEKTLDCKIVYLPKSDRSTNDFTKVMDEIYRQNKQIDVVVHNGHNFVLNRQDEACFALNEGESLIEILNIFKYCIPKMYMSNGGHIISIKSNQSSFQALINTRNDFRNYILDLISNFRRSTQNSEPSIPRSKPEFSLSVIQCDNSWSSQVSEKELVRRIHEGIVSQRAVVRIGSGTWNVMKGFLKYFNRFSESSLHLL